MKRNLIMVLVVHLNMVFLVGQQDQLSEREYVPYHIMDSDNTGNEYTAKFITPDAQGNPSLMILYLTDVEYHSELTQIESSSDKRDELLQERQSLVPSLKNFFHIIKSQDQVIDIEYRIAHIEKLFGQLTRYRFREIQGSPGSETMSVKEFSLRHPNLAAMVSGWIFFRRANNRIILQDLGNEGLQKYLQRGSYVSPSTDHAYKMPEGDRVYLDIYDYADDVYDTLQRYEERYFMDRYNPEIYRPENDLKKIFKYSYVFIHKSLLETVKGSLLHNCLMLQRNAMQRQKAYEAYETDQVKSRFEQEVNAIDDKIKVVEHKKSTLAQQQDDEQNSVYAREKRQAELFICEQEQLKLSQEKLRISDDYKNRLIQLPAVFGQQRAYMNDHFKWLIEDFKEDKNYNVLYLVPLIARWLPQHMGGGRIKEPNPIDLILEYA